MRRYGLRVSRDARRRLRVAAERIQIIASLRELRTQDTPEATAAVIAEALGHLPGVDIAGVFERTEKGLVALAVVAMPEFPVKTGDTLPGVQARHILEGSSAGPWAERWTPPPDPDGYDRALSALGIKGRAFAPVLANG